MNLPKELPIWEVEQAILKALEEKPVVIVSAETGSGKSTQIPQMLYRAGLTYVGMHPNGQEKHQKIGVSQPRRLAAASVAKRVAEEMEVDLSKEVGFQVRFTRELNPETRIIFATEGIFLQEAKTSPLFTEYAVIMLDEVHERSLDMDILLGLAKRAVQSRPELRIIVSSATVNIPAMEAFFGDLATVVECEGRAFPLTTIYEQTDPTINFVDWQEAKHSRGQLKQFEMPEYAAKKAAELIQTGERGDILVFLAGFDELKRAHTYLRQANLDVNILFARGEMELEKLEELFQDHLRQRVIFATNVAETSITIPGITVTIISGMVKQDFFDPKTGIQSLRLVKACRSSCWQQASRAARTQPGTAYFLFSKEEYQKRPEYAIPAIQRSNLTNVILTLATIGINEPASFPLLDHPGDEIIAQNQARLRQLGAISENGTITDYGKMLSRFPLTPEKAHLLVQAHQEDALAEMATFLAMSDAKPFRRQDQDDFLPGYLEIIPGCKSDPQLILAAWQGYYDSGFEWKWAKGMGLRPNALREARQIRGQLLEIAAEQGLKPTSATVDYEQLAIALIKAMPENIAVRAGYYDQYQTRAAGESYTVHPSSLLARAVTDIIWFFNSHQTNRLFASCCLPLSLADLLKICPELIEKDTVSDHGWLFPGEIRIYEEFRLRGITLEKKLTEIKEKPIPPPRPIGESVNWAHVGRLLAGYGTLEPEPEPVKPIEKWAAPLLPLSSTPEGIPTAPPAKPYVPSPEVSNIRQGWQKQIKGLEQAIPVLDETIPSDIADLAEELRRQLRRMRENVDTIILDRDFERARQLLQELKQNLEQYQLHEEQRQAQLQIHQAELRECAELLQLAVEIDMATCPLCYALFDEKGCICVQSLPGQIARDLVYLKTGSGGVLGRIHVDCPGNGSPKRVRREIYPLERPFEGDPILIKLDP